MSNYYGDFPTNHTNVVMDFDSFAAATGAPSATTNFAAADIQIYKDGGTTQRSSANGITVSTSFDTQTGLQLVNIDLSDNTDAGFYAAGHEYTVAVADITVDGQTLRFWLGAFSIERAGGILALLKATGSVKVDVVKWNSQTVATPAVNGVPIIDLKYILGTAVTEGGAGRDAAGFTKLFDVAAPVLTAASVNQTGDSYALANGANGFVATYSRIGAPAGASIAADIAAIFARLGAPAGASNAADVAAIYARLGAPAGASVAADIAALPTAAQNADKLLGRNVAGGSDGGRTVFQAFYFLRNKWTISSGTLTVYGVDDTTVSWTAAVSSDAAAVPIIGNDPA